MVVVKAKLKNLKIAPRKVRLIADSIKGLHVQVALAQLDVMPQRSVGPITKLIRSAIANANEQKLDTEKLIIDSIRVDKGITLKRSIPRARGRATLIEKKMSHISLELKESDHVTKPKYVLEEKKKEESKKRGAKQSESPKFKPEEATKKEKTQKGFKDKVFRRKSV